MSTVAIPDWVWKFISVCVIPLIGWVWSTHNTVTVLEQELKHATEEIETLDGDVEKLKRMETTIAVMQRDIEHISENIDELTKLMTRMVDKQ